MYRACLVWALVLALVLAEETDTVLIPGTFSLNGTVPVQQFRHSS